MDPDSAAVPAPSRASAPGRFGPRGASRIPETLLEMWRRRIALAATPIGVLVAIATATMGTVPVILMYLSPVVLGGLVGAWSATGREGFGRGFLAGWLGYFLGTWVGVPLQVLRTPGFTWSDLATAIVVGPFLGAFFGILFGLVTGFAAYVGARLHTALRPTQVGLPPRA